MEESSAVTRLRARVACPGCVPKGARMSEGGACTRLRVRVDIRAYLCGV